MTFIQGSKIALAPQWNRTAVPTCPTSCPQSLLLRLTGVTTLAMEASVFTTPASDPA